MSVMRKHGRTVFFNFLNDDLLKFCYYGTHKHTYSAGSGFSGIDALTNLSSKEVEEYFVEHGGNYCSTNNATRSVKDRNRNKPTQKFAPSPPSQN